MSILVTGGRRVHRQPYCVELVEAGYDIVVADNLSNSCEEAVHRVEHIVGRSIPFVKAELTHADEVEELFERFGDIDSVIHFAGLKAVGESVAKPLEYYYNNLTCTLEVLKAMRRHNVKNFVFSSSATVYGDPERVPISEDFPTGGTTNPYGTTKLFQERILMDYCAADPTMNVALLRYFNPIGAHESGLIGEDPRGIPNNLVPYIAQVAVGKLEKLHVYGDDYPTHDGTGVRDYIHVVDLARGHVAALRKLAQNCGLFTCNLGTARATACSTCCTPMRRPAARPCPTSSTRAVPATSPSATPTPRRPATSWAGRPGTASKRCARAPGSGRAPIRTVYNA